MADDVVTDTPRTIIIERRGGGGAILIGLALLIAVVVGAFFPLNRSKNDNLKTNAIISAAKDVGQGARKVGDSAEKAADDATGN